MEPKLLQAVTESMPAFNDRVIDGFHQRQFDEGHKVYEQGLKQLFKHLPKKGVRFNRLELVSPKEYVQYLTNHANRTCDIHEESLYPVKLIFEYLESNGEWDELKPCYQMLNYTNRYGDVFLRNSFYNLNIVLAERGLPVTREGSIFIKILGYKFKVTTEPFRYSLVFNDHDMIKTDAVDVNISANRFYSPSATYRIDGKSKIPRPLLSWYIFGKLGFTEAMERYSECDYEMGHVDTIQAECKSADGWHIMKGYGGPLLKQLGRTVDNDFAIAIRNKNRNRKEINPMGLQYAVSLLYVAEHCSTYFEMSRINDPDYWKLIIGRCSVKGNMRDEQILKLMISHFSSVDEYLGDDSIKRFRRHGIDCNDIEELFNYISVNRSDIVQTTDRADMTGKELTSIEHTLDVLWTAANGFNHFVKNTSDLTRRKVEKKLPEHFKHKIIDNAMRANMEIVSTPTDCPLAEHILAVVPQDKVNPPRGQGSKDFDPMDSAKSIHPSLPFINSYLRITEPNPDGRGYLNPCIYLENDKVTAIRPDLLPLYEQVKQRLNQRESRHDNQTTKPS